MNNNPQKDLLLHTCCGPCAAGCVGTLANADRKFVMYFSNSNLSDKEEYERRLEAAKKGAETISLLFLTEDSLAQNFGRELVFSADL